MEPFAVGGTPPLGAGLALAAIRRGRAFAALGTQALRAALGGSAVVALQIARTPGFDVRLGHRAVLPAEVGMHARDARPSRGRPDVRGESRSAPLPAVVEERGRQVAPQLLAAAGAKPGAHDDLGARRAHRREAGIEDVRLHDLRHTHASHAVMNGVPVPVVSRMLGHSNVRMTLRYAHLGAEPVNDFETPTVSIY